MMINISLKTLSFFLTLYIMSVIVFRENFHQITHVVNLFLILNFIFLLLIKKDINFKFNQIIVAYMLFSIFSIAGSFWALDFDLASHKSIQLFLILINIFIIYNIIIKYNLQNSFLTGILFASFINFVLILNIIPAPFPIFEQGRAMGTLGNANVLGLTMVISIFSSIIYLQKEKEISKIFFYYQYINIFLSIYMIILTASKKGILFGSSLILIYLILSIKDPKNLFKLALVSVIAVIIVLNFINIDELRNNLADVAVRFSEFENQLGSESRFGSTGQRIYFIELALSYFMDRPLFGHGLNNFSIYAGTYSHNNYVEILFSVGLVGFLLYYSIFFFILQKIFNMKDKYLQIILTFVMLNMLLVDMATVTYYDKFYIFTLLFISIYAEKNSKKGYF